MWQSHQQFCTPSYFGSIPTAAVWSWGSSLLSTRSYHSSFPHAQYSQKKKIILLSSSSLSIIHTLFILICDHDQKWAPWSRVTCHPAPSLAWREWRVGWALSRPGPRPACQCQLVSDFTITGWPELVTDSLAKISGTRVKFLDTKHRPAWPA